MLKEKILAEFDHYRPLLHQLGAATERFTDSGRFGYRSLHYVCAPGPEQTPHPDFRFEIQIRTALQHAWAEVEHDLGYKAQDAVPELRGWTSHQAHRRRVPHE